MPFASLLRRNGGGEPAPTSAPATTPAATAPQPPARLSADRIVRSRWYPGIRVTLTLLVLAPVLSVGFLTAADASSSWSNRQGARTAAQDVIELQHVAQARAELNAALVPTMAVAFAVHIGVDEAELSSLLHIDLPQLFAENIPPLRTDPVFTSTPTLKAATASFLATIPNVEAAHVDFRQESDLASKFAFDLDDVWFADFDRLQSDMASWHAPESLEAHLAALRFTYLAFITGEYQLEGTSYVLQGLGSTIVVDPKGGWQTMTAKQEAIWFSDEYAQMVKSFTGHLGPLALGQWNAMEADPKVQFFQVTMAEGLHLAIQGGTSPFASDISLAGKAQNDGLVYLHDLNLLVQAASKDLRNQATVQASLATAAFIRELLLLAALIAVTGGAVLLGGRTLSSPLKRLAGAANQITEGEFGFERIPATGPRELASAAAMVNDMSFTLKAVEAKAVALAAENLDDPELRSALPGRTGRALQAAVDRLTDRTRERELLRRQLQEEATHDRLTGLLNRAAVLGFLDDDVSRRRLRGESVAVLFVDLDGLKPLNDNFGHEVGDSAIRAAADSLVRSAGPCDVVGRLGGDEFLVVLCAEHSAHAAAIAADIKAAMAMRTISTRDQLVSLQCSIGVALAVCDIETDPKDLVRQADEAMYEAKKAARVTRDRMAAAAMQEVVGTAGPSPASPPSMAGQP